ncbi:MAG: GNAT family N-acetyltransferase [Pseudomonadota bacterium]
MTPHLADTPVIQTARLTLRAPRIDDYPVWEAFYASDRARFIGGPGTPRDAWRAYGHIVGMWALCGCGSFVIADASDAPRGMAGPWVPPYYREKEIGWTIWSDDAEGRGIAFEAATAARRFAYAELGWTTAVSYIDDGNDRSVALADRLGARRDDSAWTPKDDARTYRHPRPEVVLSDPANPPTEYRRNTDVIPTSQKGPSDAR